MTWITVTYVKIDKLRGQLNRRRFYVDQHARCSFFDSGTALTCIGSPSNPSSSSSQQSQQPSFMIVSRASIFLFRIINHRPLRLRHEVLALMSSSLLVWSVPQSSPAFNIFARLFRTSSVGLITDIDVCGGTRRCCRSRVDARWRRATWVCPQGFLRERVEEAGQQGFGF